jgi:hypothetical protein
MAAALWTLRDLEGALALAGQVGLGFLAYTFALGLLDLAFGRSHLLRLLRRGPGHKADCGPALPAREVRSKARLRGGF